MIDIVERARRHATDILDPGYPYYETPELVREMADEIERLRLTDAEREAVEWFAAGDETCYGWGWKSRAATLRGLLERTQTVEK